MFEVIFKHDILGSHTVNVVAADFMEAYNKLASKYDTASYWNEYGLENIISFKAIGYSEVEYIK